MPLLTHRGTASIPIAAELDTRRVCAIEVRRQIVTLRARAGQHSAQKGVALEIETPFLFLLHKPVRPGGNQRHREQSREQLRSGGHIRRPAASSPTKKSGAFPGLGGSV
jgi:hypothetical protein